LVDISALTALCSSTAAAVEFTSSATSRIGPEAGEGADDVAGNDWPPVAALVAWLIIDVVSMS